MKLSIIYFIGNAKSTAFLDKTKLIKKMVKDRSVSKSNSNSRMTSGRTSPKTNSRSTFGTKIKNQQGLKMKNILEKFQREKFN